MAVRDVVQAAAGQGGGDKLYVEDVFSTYLYTGTATTLNIENNIDLAGEGGLTWIKSRSSSSLIHVLHDTERGAPERLNSASTDAQATMGAGIGITSFNSNGFTLGTGTNYNASGGSYASWTWRKSPKFFDVVTGTTGSDTNYRISHNLGSVPGCIIFKRTDAASTWFIWHRGLSSTTDNYLKLGYNATAGQATRTNTWGTSGPTDTDFGIDTTFFGAGIPFVAFVYAHDAGGFGDDDEQNIISCGSYTTAANYSGPNVNLGFEPAWILVKNASGNGAWSIIDNMRGWSADGNVKILNPDSSSSESSTTQFKINATGFQDNGGFAANSTFIYIAIRRPMKTPTSGTEVFDVSYVAGTGSERNVDAGLPVDTFFIKDITALSGPTQFGSNIFYNRLAGNSRYLYGGLAETTQGLYSCLFDSIQNGVILGSGWSSYVYIQYAFARANSFFDTVCFTGNGVSGQTYSHNLGVTPELMFVKSRDPSGEWWGYSSTLGATKYMILNNSDAAGTSSLIWNDTAPTSSVFSVGSYTQVNGSGVSLIAYLFASCPGVSKIGTYIGTGADLNVDCGFSAGARFVMIKRTDSTGGWYVWDSARGITAGNDPYFFMNSYLAQVGNTDYIDPLASGFTVTSSAPAALNASGGNFLFLAIA